MAWAKPTETMIAAFAAALPEDARVERKQMFGCPVGFVNGNMFAGLHENTVVLRLPEEERARLEREHRAVPFAPMAGRVMKDWVALPARLAEDGRALATLVADAFAHALALPPKPEKAKRPSRKTAGGGRKRR
jgi:TfoX/Sxy family transcriptional regulator of competence genes